MILEIDHVYQFRHVVFFVLSKDEEYESDVDIVYKGLTVDGEIVLLCYSNNDEFFHILDQDFRAVIHHGYRDKELKKLT